MFYHRHGLQQALLSSGTPEEGALSTADVYMTSLEKIQTWDAETIKATKLGKLLKSIIKNNQLPQYGKYNFRKRAQDLAQRLDKIIESQETSK